MEKNLGTLQQATKNSAVTEAKSYSTRLGLSHSIFQSRNQIINKKVNIPFHSKSYKIACPSEK